MEEECMWIILTRSGKEIVYNMTYLHDPIWTNVTVPLPKLQIHMIDRNDPEFGMISRPINVKDFKLSMPPDAILILTSTAKTRRGFHLELSCKGSLNTHDCGSSDQHNSAEIIQMGPGSTGEVKYGQNEVELTFLEGSPGTLINILVSPHPTFLTPASEAEQDSDESNNEEYMRLFKYDKEEGFLRVGRFDEKDIGQYFWNRTFLGEVGQAMAVYYSTGNRRYSKGLAFSYSYDPV